MQESIGLTNGFTITPMAYVVGIIVFMSQTDGYCRKLRQGIGAGAEQDVRLPAAGECLLYGYNTGHQSKAGVP